MGRGRAVRIVAFGLAVGLFGGACSRSPGPGTSPGGTSNPTAGSGGGPSGLPGTTGGAPTSPAGSPTEIPDLQAVRIRLEQVVTLRDPVALVVRPHDDALYVVERIGFVRRMRAGTVEDAPVLDLSDAITAGGEQGLLGLAFSPDGAFLYVNYTDLEGDTRVVEFAIDGDDVIEGSRREVLFVDQPFSNHNGGDLVFGPDGYLYIGLGDGGSGGDPMDNGQNLGALLGKMLRIDPRPHGDDPYTIPPDNPFVGREGARPEIWAFGLRNPWRYTFDRQTGDLWIGDVGQNRTEEVDFQAAGSHGGENYGWNRLEGTDRYEGDAPPGAVPPVFEYSHIGTPVCSVIGGYVYRGSAVPDLQGVYVFADFCLGRIWGLRLVGGDVVAQGDLGEVVPNLASFGEDQDGELYALSLSGEVYRIESAD